MVELTKTYLFSDFVKISSCSSIRQEGIYTHTDAWTHRHTLQHVDLSNLEDKSQCWVFICIQTDDTTNQKGPPFQPSFGMMLELSWAILHKYCRKYCLSVFGNQNLVLMSRSALICKWTARSIIFFMIFSNPSINGHWFPIIAVVLSFSPYFIFKVVQ